MSSLTSIGRPNIKMCQQVNVKKKKNISKAKKIVNKQSLCTVSLHLTK